MLTSPLEPARAWPDDGGTGGWGLELADGERRLYKGLIVATGLQWTPRQPALPGRFAGELLHSSAYRAPHQAAGRRVLVVGGGNSGCDIAVDVCGAALRTLLNLRRDYWFVPKHLFGKPADEFGRRGPGCRVG